MIRKTTKTTSQDKVVYSDKFRPFPKSKHFVIYGTVEQPFFLAENVVLWLKLNMPYQDLLCVVNDSDRMAKFISENGEVPKLRWCLTKDGLHSVIDYLYVLDKNKRSRLHNEVDDGIKEFIEASHEADDEVPNTTKYTVNEIMQNPDILINALNKLKEEQEKNKKLTENLRVQSEKITELEPKAEYYDKILNTTNGVSPSVIAKDYGKSALWLNKLLHKLKIQYKQGETWLLYSRYDDKGYTCTKTHQYTDEYGNSRSVMHTYWTQAGRKFIYDLLKKHGIKPITVSEESE